MKNRCFIYFIILLNLVIGVFAGQSAYAHGMRTGYLQITENAPAKYWVMWKMLAADTAIELRFPATCQQQKLGTMTEKKQAKGNRLFQLDCQKPIFGEKIAILGMGSIITETIVTVEKLDGKVYSKILTANTNSWVMPKTMLLYQAAAEYLTLGFFHILTGGDHLLFILGLLLLLATPKQAIYSISAFTLAHSITLSLSVLGYVNISSQWAEACIALSLVFVALELSRHRDGGHQASAFGFLFGLVHGLGFAGALSEIGLAENHLAISLASFNIGVELGQLFFMAVGFLVLSLSKFAGKAHWLRQVSFYTLGSLGCFWFIDRTMPLIQLLTTSTTA